MVITRSQDTLIPDTPSPLLLLPATEADPPALPMVDPAALNTEADPPALPMVDPAALNTAASLAALPTDQADPALAPALPTEADPAPALAMEADPQAMDSRPLPVPLTVEAVMELPLTEC
jgi:hypothetical protein